MQACVNFDVKVAETMHKSPTDGPTDGQRTDGREADRAAQKTPFVDEPPFTNVTPGGTHG